MKRPASRKHGQSSTPSTDWPAASSASATASGSCGKWPRMVESLRLATASSKPSSAAIAAARSVISVLTAIASRSGIERELVSTKTVPASVQGAGEVLARPRGEDGHAVHGLRARGVVVDHQQAPARRDALADLGERARPLQHRWLRGQQLGRGDGVDRLHRSRSPPPGIV